MKKSTLALTALLITANLPGAFAQGNGTKGNGEGVIIDGKLRLADLVDPGTCINGWSKGA
jgi:hypothetical protein